MRIPESRKPAVGFAHRKPKYRVPQSPVEKKLGPSPFRDEKNRCRQHAFRVLRPHRSMCPCFERSPAVLSTGTFLREPSAKEKRRRSKRSPRKTGRIDGPDASDTNIIPCTENLFRPRGRTNRRTAGRIRGLRRNRPRRPAAFGLRSPIIPLPPAFGPATQRGAPSDDGPADRQAADRCRGSPAL